MDQQLIHIRYRYSDGTERAVVTEDLSGRVYSFTEFSYGGAYKRHTAFRYNDNDVMTSAQIEEFCGNRKILGAEQTFDPKNQQDGIHTFARTFYLDSGKDESQLELRNDSWVREEQIPEDLDKSDHIIHMFHPDGQTVKTKTVLHDSKRKSDNDFIDPYDTMCLYFNQNGEKVCERYFFQDNNYAPRRLDGNGFTEILYRGGVKVSSTRYRRLPSGDVKDGPACRYDTDGNRIDCQMYQQDVPSDVILYDPPASSQPVPRGSVVGFFENLFGKSAKAEKRQKRCEEDAERHKQIRDNVYELVEGISLTDTLDSFYKRRIPTA